MSTKLLLLSLLTGCMQAAPVSAKAEAELIGQTTVGPQETKRNLKSGLAWLPPVSVAYLPLLFARADSQLIDAGMPDLPSDHCNDFAQSGTESHRNNTPYLVQTGGVRVADELPVRFTQPMNGPPPQDSLFHSSVIGSGSAEVAAAFLFVFDDRNDDDVFEPATDFVTATSDTDAPSFIMFVDGVLGTTSIPFPMGYSRLKLSRQWTGHLESLTEPLSLVDRRAGRVPLEAVGCADYTETRSTGETGPVPPLATIQCDPSGRSYFWELSTGRDCKLTSRSGARCLAPAAPKPNDWPCQ